MDGNLIEAAEPETGEASDFKLAPEGTDKAVSEPTQRARGRKKMPRDENGNIIREGKTESPKVDAPTRRATKKAVDVQTFANQLVGIHQMIAKLPGMGNFEISKDEAAMLAPAMVQCSEEYGVSVSPKTAATFQLVAVGFMVYAPRIGITIAEIKASKKPRLPEVPEFSSESGNVGVVSVPASAS